MNKTSNADAASQMIIQIIDEKRPENVNQLVTLIEQKLHLKQNQVLEIILDLQKQGKIKLENQPQPTPLNLASYLANAKALWYWATIIISILTVVVVFTIPETLLPWSYLRNTLGLIFVLWLPGYTLIKTLFPVQVPIKMPTKDLDTIERITLSLGMSLVLVPLVTLFMNYTPWGISLTPITICLLTLSLVFATAALFREYQAKTKTQT